MILLLTRIWPTPQRPSLGSFVRDRAFRIPGLRVVRPRSMTEPWPLLYPRLFMHAMLVSSPIRGVEAHVVVPTGLVGWAVARLRRVPLVVYAHGGDVREWEAKPWPIRWLTTFVARHADRVVTNSVDTAFHIRRMGVEPRIAAPGTRLQRFGPTARPTRRRVLYLGGANSRKGYEVARELADTLVGPWLRDIEPKDVPALIAEHDVVLMPSMAEPFGLAAVEAIASGRWVVAAAVGGLRDIVIHGVNGTLVSDGDFRRALETVPDYDPYEVARTADRWSLERWQEAMATIWEELLGPYTPIHPREDARQELA
jgi:glycosyltransferase involved in cell wall biosynthesis